jgi:hypothetical protein
LHCDEFLQLAPPDDAQHTWPPLQSALSSHATVAPLHDAWHVRVMPPSANP